MLTFPEIYAIYEETGLPCYPIRCLKSDNEYERNYAVETLRKLKPQTKSDVLLFIATNI